MPGYGATEFRPPAPVALVTVRAPKSGAIVEQVKMLLDTGADVSLLPRDLVAGIVDAGQNEGQYELEAFDGSRSLAPAARLEIQLLGKSFRGQFLLVDGSHGILGRNILNSLALTLDGPAQSWDLRR